MFLVSGASSSRFSHTVSEHTYTLPNMNSPTWVWKAKSQDMAFRTLVGEFSLRPVAFWVAGWLGPGCVAGSVGWQAGRVAGWLVGWMAGWLGRLAGGVAHRDVSSVGSLALPGYFLIV